jgi:CDP-diacylglycerol--glycerol-3-phosphate 3-phosphatidyltransferase
MGLRGLRGTPAELPDFAGYLALWSAQHGGYDPRGNGFVHGWLRLTYLVAAPAARRGVSPNGLTALGVLVCALVPALAAPGGGWPLLAVPVIVASGLVDGVDGAVAVLTGRVTRFGAVLDGVADRLGEALYVLALWLLGAPAWVCVLAGGLAVLQEYARARAGAAGMTEIGVVTVSERASRIVVTAFTLGFAGLAGVVLPGAVDVVALIGTGAWAALGAVGLTQFLVAARRHLG